MKILFVLIFSFSFAMAQDKIEQAESFSLKDDFLTSLGYMGQASYKQFTTPQGWVIGTGAIATLTYLFDQDERISAHSATEETNEDLIKALSDSFILFNTPIVPAGFYYWAKKNNDLKMKHFAQELFATVNLSLGEAVVLSAIPLHERPDQKDLSVWETAFRGRSSFPSGHVVGIAALTFKTFQYYGPAAALAPAVLTGAIAFERVHNQKHYVSDVMGGIFVALLASEGVRVAAKYQETDPVYKWIFQHELSAGFIQQEGIRGLAVSARF